MRFLISIRSLALPLLLTVGLLPVCGIVAGLFGMCAETLSKSASEDDGVHYQTVQFTSDRTPILGTYQRHAWTYLTLDGEFLGDQVVDHQVHMLNQQLLNRVGIPMSSDWRLRLHRFTTTTTMPGTKLTGLAMWYFVADGKSPGLGYFVGYDSSSFARLGYLGVNGFSAERPPPSDQFPAADASGKTAFLVSSQKKLQSRDFAYAYHMGFLLEHTPGAIVWLVAPSHNQIWQLDLDLRTVRQVRTPDDPRVDSLEPVLTAFGQTRCMIRSGRELTLHDLTHAFRADRRIRIPDSLPRFSQWLDLGPDKNLWMMTSLPNKPTQLVWSDDQGHITNERELVLKNSWSQSPSVTASQSVAMSITGSPLIIEFLTTLSAANESRWVGVADDEESDLAPVVTTFGEALKKNVRLWQIPLIVCQTLAVLLASISWFRLKAEARSLAERWTWAVWIGIVGLPAFLAFLGHVSRNHRVRCTTCAQFTPCHFATCQICQTSFAPPAKRGCEVFAS